MSSKHLKSSRKASSRKSRSSKSRKSSSPTISPLSLRVSMGCSYQDCANVASRDEKCTDSKSYTSAVSGGKKLRVCAGCKITRYCCREHQKKDWKTHKAFCRQFASLVDAEDPAERGWTQHRVMLRSFEARLDAQDIAGALRKARELMTFSHEVLPRMLPAGSIGVAHEAQIVSCLCFGRAATRRDPSNHLEFAAWDQGIKILQVGLEISVCTKQMEDVGLFHLLLAHAFSTKEDCDRCQEHLDAVKPFEPLDDVWDTETLWKTKCSLATLRKTPDPHEVIDISVAWINDLDTRFSTFKYKFVVMVRSLYFVAGLISFLPLPSAPSLALKFAERTILLLEKNQDQWVDGEHTLMYYRMTGILSSLCMRLGQPERAREVLLKNVSFAKAHPELARSMMDIWNLGASSYQEHVKSMNDADLTMKMFSAALESVPK